MSDLPHISVCVCTYKRGASLARLLRELDCQDTDGLFTYSIVVADNDRLESARPFVVHHEATGRTAIRYCVEPRQNIALARNKALQHATGDLIAFIDDDEFPAPRWLVTLCHTLQASDAHGVLGPVTPLFVEAPPAWVVKGKFYERPRYPTGFTIDWKKGRTGNVLFKAAVFAGLAQAFRPAFRTGEDQDFFRRAMLRGQRFIWCDEAVAYEEVPASRWRRGFMLRRALLRGSVSVAHPTTGPAAIAKSGVAAVLYGTALPFAWLAGAHRFMICLVRLCDHGGRLLASVGIHLVKEPYVTE